TPRHRQGQPSSGSSTGRSVARVAVRSVSTARGPVPRQRSLLQRIWAARMIYLYLFPIFALLAIFNYYPPISAFIHALTLWDGISPPTFNGLDNFRTMLDDRDLITSTVNLVKLLVVGLIIGITVPIFVAELIFNIKNARVSYFWRLMIIIPVVVPGIV